MVGLISVYHICSLIWLFDGPLPKDAPLLPVPPFLFSSGSAVSPVTQSPVYSFVCVFTPAMPSGASPLRFWNASTAARVVSS